MPQATPHSRALAIERFGDIGTDGQIRLLESRGYVLTKDWCWTLPTPGHNAAQDEVDCIEFLADEWDFGWVVR